MKDSYTTKNNGMIIITVNEKEKSFVISPSSLLEILNNFFSCPPKEFNRFEVPTHNTQKSS